MSFRVGQKAVCVDDGNYQRDYFHEQFPVRGEIYTLRTVESDRGLLFVRLFEIINKPAYYSVPGYMVECRFKASRFRPVDETFGEEVAERVESLLQEEPETITKELCETK